MQLGRASTYALLAATHLAQHSTGRPVLGRDIADACGLPTGHLLKILQQLVRSQILTSERGPSGGFLLRKSPDDVSMLEVIEAIEGPITGELRMRDIADTKLVAARRLEQACCEVASQARVILGNKTIASLLNGR